MICIYHNDLDGRAAAAVVAHVTNGCHFIEMSYSDGVPWDQIVRGEEVIIVDFSLQRPGEWEQLLEITQDITWLDHHESAIKSVPKVVLDIAKGLRDINRSGAKLAWDYYCYDRGTPRAIRLVDLWDRWVHNDDPEILDFVAGMSLDDTRPKAEIWENLFDFSSEDVFIEAIIRDGSIVNRYKILESQSTVARGSYRRKFEGYQACIVHHQGSGSKLFDSIKNTFELCVVCSYNGKQWTVHLYSDRVKANDIAQKYGGGGHAGAAGFICEQLPKELW